MTDTVEQRIVAALEALAGDGKRQYSCDVTVEPYTNPRIDKLLKKLKKVKYQRWLLEHKGNFITITSANE